MGDGIEMLGVVAVVLALVAILLWRQAAAGRAELRRVRGLADRESERFASLVSGSPAGIYQIDSEGRVVFANPAWRQMAGFGPDEDVGNEWAQRIHPDDLAQMAEWQRQAREGAATIESAFRFIRPGGEERWFEGRTAALPADDGAVAGFIGTIIDVTERERTRIRLGESERLHRAIVDGAVEAFVMTDRDGVIVAVNPAAKVMFAVREGDVEGQHLATLIPGITEMVTHAPRRMEARRSDGRTVMVDVSISFAHTRDARFTAIARDVTAEVEGERRRREHDLEQTALRDLAASIPASAGIDALARDASGRLLGLTGVDTVLVAEFVDDGTAAVLRGSASRTGPSVAAGARHRLVPDGPLQRVLGLGHFASRGVGGADARVGPVMLARQLCVPIISDDRVWGALVAGNVTPGPLPDRLQETLRGFAGILGLAVWADGRRPAGEPPDAPDAGTATD
ncbi:MAG: PAS domain S-box protein [Thermoleophilia bacterium]|nr:PAS domain S-box protein [Thermoleophilia bacterium]